MKSISLPRFAVRGVLQSCADSITMEPLKENLLKVVDEIEAVERDYFQRGPKGTLFEIKEATNVAGIVSADDMKRVYRDTFVKSAKTRHIYSALKKAPSNDICPLCGQRTVSTLDHYLSQSRHPSLVVTPFNLVPACAECNKSKLNKQPLSSGELTIHPYFDDDFDDERWLFAKVEKSTPAHLIFDLAPPTSWPRGEKGKACATFYSLWT
jgi:hypothetical protein